MPAYREILLHSVLTGARDSDPLVRASALSNIGELCKGLHFALGNVLHEVLLHTYISSFNKQKINMNLFKTINDITWQHILTIWNDRTILLDHAIGNFLS